MVYKYTRKSDRAAGAKETLKEVVSAVTINDSKSINFVSKQYGVPDTTLQLYFKENCITKQIEFSLFFHRLVLPVI